MVVAPFGGGPFAEAFLGCGASPVTVTSVPTPYSDASTLDSAFFTPAEAALTVTTRPIPTARPKATKIAWRIRRRSSRRRYVAKNICSPIRDEGFATPDPPGRNPRAGAPGRPASVGRCRVSSPEAAVARRLHDIGPQSRARCGVPLPQPEVSNPDPGGQPGLG